MIQRMYICSWNFVMGESLSLYAETTSNWTRRGLPNIICCMFGSFVIIRLFTRISNPKILSFVSVWPKFVIWGVRQRSIRIWGRQYVDSSLSYYGGNHMAINILSYEMITGSTPFKIKTERELTKILHNHIKYPPELSGINKSQNSTYTDYHKWL